MAHVAFAGRLRIATIISLSACPWSVRSSTFVVPSMKMDLGRAPVDLTYEKEYSTYYLVLWL
jgi:hypothetical protein